MNELVKQEQGFLALLKEISILNEVDALLGWDALTGMPEASTPQRSEVTSYIAGLAFEKSVSSEMVHYLTFLTQHLSELNPDTQKMVEKVQKEYDLNHKIPQTDYQEFIKVISQADSAWRKARVAKDFNLFKPSLTKIIDFEAIYWILEKR